MARISGIDIPKEKRGVIALTYIYGIGKSRAQKILSIANVSEDKKVLEEFLDSMGEKYYKNVEKTIERLFGVKDIANYDYMYRTVGKK